MVDGADVAPTPGVRAIVAASQVALDDAGRRGDDDVRSESELRVDARLLVVGGGEQAEFDAEREQQADDDADRG